MASYTTRLGDTPGKISLLMTGTPIHVADLVAANPQKARNAAGTFVSLMPGEQLKLPDNWFKGRPGLPGLAAPPAGYQYPGAFGPKYGGSGGTVMQEPSDRSIYPVTEGSSIYGQYYVYSGGKLTLGALIMAAHGDQVIAPGFQSAALTNANPQLAGMDPNVSIAEGTRVNIPSRWVDALKKAGYNVGNNMGVGGCPKADAMLKQVDPYGLTQNGQLGSPVIASSGKSVGGKPLEALAVLATAVGAAVAVAVAFKAWGPGGAKSNPRGRIGPTGIQPTESIRLKVGNTYAMGASSNPKLVVIDSVTDDRISYHEYDSGKPAVIERWIGEDLLANGERTFRSKYGVSADTWVRKQMGSRKNPRRRRR